MPLNLVALTSGLESVASSPPSTSAACADEWADAVESFALAIVPPSTTVSAAAAALAAALAGAFAAPAAAPGMELAFTAFASTVSGGMAGFVPTPPPAPVGFAAQFAGPYPPTHGAAALAVGGIIDTWMRTGTATPAGGGAPVNWS